MGWCWRFHNVHYFRKIWRNIIVHYDWISIRIVIWIIIIARIPRKIYQSTSVTSLLGGEQQLYKWWRCLRHWQATNLKHLHIYLLLCIKMSMIKKWISNIKFQHFYLNGQINKTTVTTNLNRIGNYHFRSTFVCFIWLHSQLTVAPVPNTHFKTNTIWIMMNMILIMSCSVISCCTIGYHDTIPNPGNLLLDCQPLCVCIDYGTYYLSRSIFGHKYRRFI